MPPVWKVRIRDLETVYRFFIADYLMFLVEIQNRVPNLAWDETTATSMDHLHIYTERAANSFAITRFCVIAKTEFERKKKTNNLDDDAVFHLSEDLMDYLALRKSEIENHLKDATHTLGAEVLPLLPGNPEIEDEVTMNAPVGVQ